MRARRYQTSVLREVLLQASNTGHHNDVAKSSAGSATLCWRCQCFSEHLPIFRPFQIPVRRRQRPQAISVLRHIYSLISSESLHNQVVKSSEITSSVIDHVVACPSRVYILVSQPNVSIEDFKSRHATPHLHSTLNADLDSRSKVIFPDVYGHVDMEQIESIVRDRCGAVPMNVDTTSTLHHKYTGLKIYLDISHRLPLQLQRQLSSDPQGQLPEPAVGVCGTSGEALGARSACASFLRRSIH